MRSPGPWRRGRTNVCRRRTSGDINRTYESSELWEVAIRITKNSLETTPGPGDWFTGAVYIDTVAAPSEASRVAASSVHFTPGARTAWHTHPNGQTIYVTEGVGLCQRRAERSR